MGECEVVRIVAAAESLGDEMIGTGLTALYLAVTEMAAPSVANAEFIKECLVCMGSAARCEHARDAGVIALARAEAPIRLEPSISRMQHHTAARQARRFTASLALSLRFGCRSTGRALH